MRKTEGTESELQSRLAGAVRKSLNTAVEAVSAAIEHAVLRARLLGALREQLACALGLVHPREALQVLFGPVDGGDGASAHVVDELGLYATVRAEHRQP